MGPLTRPHVCDRTVDQHARDGEHDDVVAAQKLTERVLRVPGVIEVFHARTASDRWFGEPCVVLERTEQGIRAAVTVAISRDASATRTSRTVQDLIRNALHENGLTVASVDVQVASVE